MARANARGAWNRYLLQLRTEGNTPALRAAAVGIGAFIGSLPVYGLHLALCVIVARLLGLNRVLTYLAANISNPLLAPFLTFAELQAGHFLRSGSTYDLTVAQFQRLDLPSVAGDLAIGSIAVGALVGAIGACVTYLSINRDMTSLREQTASAAADHYIESGLWTWEFANQKLRRDPIYHYAVAGAALPGGGTIVDFGCGIGLTLVLLRTAATLHRTGSWPAESAPPPLFERFVGVEPRPSVAATAARALGDGGTIVTVDGRSFEWPPCDAVMFFDVLHLIPYEDQEAILVAARRRLHKHGVVIVREADTSMGVAFQLVRMANVLRSVARGRLRPRFFFRSAEQWNQLFIKVGFEPRVERQVSVFRANVAFRLTLASAEASRLD